MTIALIVAPGEQARGGQFELKACAASGGNYSSAAFGERYEFVTRGMRIKRACNPHGSGLRGVVTANVVRRGRVERHAKAVVEVRAEPGTRFTGQMVWSAACRRRDARYAIQVWAEGPGVRVPIVNDSGRRARACAPRARVAGWRQRRIDITGATRIIQRVVCRGSSRHPWCSARTVNFISTRSLRASVEDVWGPSVQITGGDLFRNPETGYPWVNNDRHVAFEASDNVGVRVVRASVGSERASEPRTCDESRTLPCPNGRGQLRVNTAKAGEGPQPVAVEAVDAAGNSSTHTATAFIDNEPPGRVDVALEGGDGWRRTNDFTLRWGNPVEPDRAPIIGARYRICRAGARECTRELAADGEGIHRVGSVTVPAPGEWALSLWRRDAAGNASDKHASVPVSLRYDPDPPRLGFEPSDPGDPTRVSARATDEVSGVAAGEIELRRQGTSTWQTLDTRRDGDRLVTRVDDAQLPAGTYEFRARAVDHARNESSTTNRLDGQQMVLALPLRAAALMRAGVVRKRTVRKVVRKRGKRRSVRRRVVRLVPAARTPFGRRVLVRGRLTSGDGQPLVGAEVQVYSRSATGPEQLVGAVRTDSGGGYGYVARATQSRVVRLVYWGTSLIRPAQSEVSLIVPARSTLRVSRRAVLNGQRVVFRGSLVTVPLPPGGKLVELQVRLSGRWQTFKTVRTDGRGRWRVPYRFRRTQCVQRYRFRLRVPAEAGYPFATGRSRHAAVTVRGAYARGCRGR